MYVCVRLCFVCVCVISPLPHPLSPFLSLSSLPLLMMHIRYYHILKHTIAQHCCQREPQMYGHTSKPTTGNPGSDKLAERLFVGCLTSQQHASVSQGRMCTDNFTHYHTEIEVADQTFHLTQSQYIDTGPTSLSPDPITPGAWHGSHWSANF